MCGQFCRCPTGAACLPGGNFSRGNIMADQGQAGDQITRHRGWFIFLALLLILAGVAAIAFPILSTFAVEVWTAIAFAIAGFAQTVHAFAARSWGGFFWGLLVGL